MKSFFFKRLCACFRRKPEEAKVTRTLGELPLSSSRYYATHSIRYTVDGNKIKVHWCKSEYHLDELIAKFGDRYNMTWEPEK